MAFILPLLPILAQIGPYTSPNAGNVPNVPHVEGRDKPKAENAPRAALPPPPVAASKGQACRDLADTAPSDAIDNAEDWAAGAKGAELAEAQACLGLAHGRRSEWGDAEAAFLAARESAGADHVARASYGAMAGNAALAGGHPDRALADLDTAKGDAEAARDVKGAAEIALDRARAFVSLSRPADARTAIDSALAALPADSDAWLLSATLYRRTSKLDLAQQHIEKASSVNPRDPAIGLEAGVIAELAGREESARKSWQSVIAMAPESPEAAQAKNYLDQTAPAKPGTRDKQ